MVNTTVHFKERKGLTLYSKVTPIKSTVKYRMMVDNGGSAGYIQQKIATSTVQALPKEAVKHFFICWGRAERAAGQSGYTKDGRKNAQPLAWLSEWTSNEGKNTPLTTMMHRGIKSRKSHTALV